MLMGKGEVECSFDWLRERAQEAYEENAANRKHSCRNNNDGWIGDLLCPFCVPSVKCFPQICLPLECTTWKQQNLGKCDGTYITKIINIILLLRVII